MFWQKRREDPDSITYQLAQVSNDLHGLEEALQAQWRYSDAIMKAMETWQQLQVAENRRLDNQLREIHERLDRMEGIR